MIPVSKFSSRLGERTRLIVLHTSEGARTVESLAAYLNRPGVQASYHGAVDDAKYEAYVNYSNAAWHLRNGNQESDGLCLCAFAGWSRAEWLRHPRMLELTAAWIAERCRARGVPITLLPDREVGAVIRNRNHPGGVTDHDGYTKGTGDGTHWDVGENFPFDAVLARARQIAGIIPQPQPVPTSEDGVAIVQLPDTPAPADWDSPRSTWPQLERVVHLAWVRGAHGWCRIRLATNHPGGYLHRAHVDFPQPGGARVEHWIDPNRGQSIEIEPPYKATREYAFEPGGSGPGVLMITYAAPTGLSVGLEYER